MKRLIVGFIILLLTATAFAEDMPEEVDKLVTSLGYVYVGMPKESLYEVFTELQQKGYRRDGADEWISFSNWVSEEKGDTVTFYLRDGKIKGWKEYPAR